MESKKTKDKRLARLKMVLLGGVSAALGYFLIGWLMEFGDIASIKGELSKAQKLGLIPATILISFLVIGVHELGHLLTGLAQGFTFELFVVGPLGIKRDPETEKVVWYFNKDLSQAGGLAAALPRNDDPSNITKFARLIIAGPLASLLLGVLFIFVSPSLPGIWSLLGFLVGGMSLLIFLVTIIPYGSGTFMSDGKRFLRLLNEESRNIEMAIMRLSSKYMQTRRYDELDMADVALMKTDEAPMMVTLAYYYAYLHYLSIGEAEKAAAEREIYTERAAAFPKGMQQFLQKEEERIKTELGLH